MTTKSLSLCAAAAVLLSSALAAVAAEPPAVQTGSGSGQVYVNPGVGLLLFREDQPSRDVLAPMVRVGCDLTDLVSLEASGIWAPAVRSHASAGRPFNATDIFGLSGDAVFHVTRWERFDPYLSAGLGAFFSERDTMPSQHQNIVTPRLGAGAMYHLTDHWSLRAGGTLMAANFDFGEMFGLLEIGAVYYFGGGATPPPPPPPTPAVTDLSAQVDRYHAGDERAADDLAIVTIVLHYEYDVSILTAKEDFAKLNAVARVLGNHPGSLALVEGHADQKTGSSKAYNQKLSEERANGAVANLAAAGIDRSRLMAKGYGFSRPTDKSKVDLKNGNPENRRVEIYIKNAGGKAAEAEYRKYLESL
jgi:outer membrane protein OmpA-like peptidoglycan-associated protein